MLASRRGPLGESPPVQSPRGRESRPHLGHSRPRTPAQPGVGSGVRRERRLFSLLPKLSQHTSPPVLLGRNKAPQERRHPRRRGTPAGRAADSPPRAARVSPAGTQTLRTAGPAPRLLPELGSLMVRGARPPRSPRSSPVPGAAAPAPARPPAAAAAGAALSRRARGPSTGDSRLRGPTPPRRSAQPGPWRTPLRLLQAATSPCTSRPGLLEFSSPGISPRSQSSSVDRPLPHGTPLGRQPRLTHSSPFPALFNYPADLLCSTADTWLAFS